MLSDAEPESAELGLESDRVERKADLHTVPGATLSDLDFPLLLREVPLPRTVAAEPSIDPDEFRAKVDEASRTPAP